MNYFTYHDIFDTRRVLCPHSTNSTKIFINGAVRGQHPTLHKGIIS